MAGCGSPFRVSLLRNRHRRGKGLSLLPRFQGRVAVRPLLEYFYILTLRAYVSTTMAVSDAAPATPVANFMAFVVSSPNNLWHHTFFETSGSSLRSCK